MAYERALGHPPASVHVYLSSSAGELLTPDYVGVIREIPRLERPLFGISVDYPQNFGTNLVRLEGAWDDTTFHPIFVTDFCAQNVDGYFIKPGHFTALSVPPRLRARVQPTAVAPITAELRAG